MLNYLVLVLLCSGVQAQFFDPVPMRNFSEMIDMQIKVQDAMIDTFGQLFRTCTDLSCSTSKLAKDMRETLERDQDDWNDVGERLDNMIGLRSLSPGTWLDKIVSSLEMFASVLGGLAAFADYTVTTISAVGKVITFSIGITIKLLAERLVKTIIAVVGSVNFHSNPLNSHKPNMISIGKSWRRIVKLISKDMLTALNPYGQPTLIGFVPSVLVDLTYSWAKVTVKLLKVFTRRIALLEGVIKEPIELANQAIYNATIFSTFLAFSKYFKLKSSAIMDHADGFKTDITGILDKEMSLKDAAHKYYQYGLYTGMTAIKRMPDALKESLTVFNTNETSTNFDVNKITSATELRMREVDMPFVTEMRKKMANESKKVCNDQISNGYNNEVLQRETRLAECNKEYEEDKLGNLATDCTNSLITAALQTSIMMATLLKEPHAEWKRAVSDWLEVLSEIRTSFVNVTKEYGSQMTADNREDRFIKCMDRAVAQCLNEISVLKATYYKCLSG